MQNKKKLIFIQFNEINFDLLEKYCDKYNFFYLKKILRMNHLTTISENKYEFLEPWIQWLSVYTGKSADEHKIFRLGDVKQLRNTNLIFEKIERKGFSVGCIAPMNATNQLKKPSYFISDPWTNTVNDKSYWSNKVAKLINKLVNNNSSGKISLIDLLNFLLIIIRFTRVFKYKLLISVIFKSIKRKWYRALLLDFILNEIHINFLKKHKPNLSSIFFNAGAHIQHHYLFFSEFNKSNLQINVSWYLNNKYDPIFDVMKFYNQIFKDYFNFFNSDLLIATGLSQEPLKKLIFYYRLKNHVNFLNKIKINYLNVLPRMSRDFLINFSNEHDAKIAENIFKNAFEVKSKSLVFEEVDNRGKSLFISLTYGEEIKKNMEIMINNSKIKFYEYVNFVAIKNGLHNGKGYLYHNDNFHIDSHKKVINIRELYNYIENYFV